MNTTKGGGGGELANYTVKFQVKGKGEGGKKKERKMPPIMIPAFFFLWGGGGG